MASGTATLEFVLRGGTATTWTHGLASLSDSLAFAGWIQPYTNAAIRRVGFTVSDELEGTERDDAFADMNIYGCAFYRNEEQNIVKFVWPAPRFDLFETVAGRHTLKQVNGAAIGSILGMMTGHQLIFRHGGISTR